ncbi:CKLF-like MARVEL transmembrane domain-containing protein 6 [Egretta garzetta]|uniref:CKLF-like MARVEL transmembrane domain-containing protein 6 n=1 Tax=Egretta garzetta TaxID=188379 RepID=UPI00163B65D3|nr:CKLF-like MARVEL transmembrane domain-containing protein 6 [Egretta garzetta]
MDMLMTSLEINVILATSDILLRFLYTASGELLLSVRSGLAPPGSRTSEAKPDFAVGHQSCADFLTRLESKTWCLTARSIVLKYWQRDSKTDSGKGQLTIFSLLAFICEEIVEDCITCGGLYFFEFTSCSAFFLSLLILCMYCTDTYETFGEDTVRRVNFGAVVAICLFFLLASIVLAATGSGSAVEKAAFVFGFLAFAAFLAEIIAECFYIWKQNIDGRSENPGNTQSATENQPLNKAS